MIVLWDEDTSAGCQVLLKSVHSGVGTLRRQRRTLQKEISWTEGGKQCFIFHSSIIYSICLTPTYLWGNERVLITRITKSQRTAVCISKTPNTIKVVPFSFNFFCFECHIFCYCMPSVCRSACWPQFESTESILDF